MDINLHRIRPEGWRRHHAEGIDARAHDFVRLYDIRFLELGDDGLGSIHIEFRRIQKAERRPIHCSTSGVLVVIEAKTVFLKVFPPRGQGLDLLDLLGGIYIENAEVSPTFRLVHHIKDIRLLGLGSLYPFLPATRPGRLCGPRSPGLSLSYPDGASAAADVPLTSRKNTI
jgi:hypothetical protein